MNKSIPFLGGVGTGLIYMLDPDKDRRRRTLVRDASNHGVHVADRAVRKTSRLKGLFRCEELDDPVLAVCVGSQLGRIVSHPQAIEVATCQGRVTLSGYIRAGKVGWLVVEHLGDE